MTRAVLLSGSIGAGHDAVASACAASLGAAGFESEVLDCMALLGRPGARVGAAVFRRLLEVPALYDAFHFSQLRAGTGLARRLEAAAASRLVPAVQSRLGEDPTALVAVFATGAGVAGRLRQQGMPVRAALAVVTDAAAHALWVHPGIDGYVVFSEMTAGTVRQHDPRAAVVVVDPPVRPGFAEAPPKAVARAALGIEAAPGEAVVLVMGGSWGRGPLAAVAARLGAENRRVVVLAGANTGLHGELARAVPGSAPPWARPVVWPATERVPELMAAADVVVSAPGQACHEARAVGRPLVVLDTVPGHGRENLLAELARGGALAAPARPEAVAAAVEACLAGAVRARPAGGSRLAGTLDDALVALL